MKRMITSKYVMFLILEMILCAGIMGAIILTTTSCTTARTKSTSRPILNRDGTVMMDQYGNYPKEIIIEVEATAGPTSTIESWMLETDIVKSANDLTFHTGSQGEGASGANPEVTLQLLKIVTQLLMRLTLP